MRRHVASLCLGGLISLLVGCSNSSDARRDTATGGDSKVANDGDQTIDSSGGDAVKADLPAGDARQIGDSSAGDGGAVKCTTSKDTCQGGLKCHCCGSIGPMPVCLCTTTCTKDSDCTRPGQPRCNKASPTDPSGLCTPAGYNCCWKCN